MHYRQRPAIQDMNVTSNGNLPNYYTSRMPKRKDTEQQTRRMARRDSDHKLAPLCPLLSSTSSNLCDIDIQCPELAETIRRRKDKAAKLQNSPDRHQPLVTKSVVPIGDGALNQLTKSTRVTKTKHVSFVTRQSEIMGDYGRHYSPNFSRLEASFVPANMRYAQTTFAFEQMVRLRRLERDTSKGDTGFFKCGNLQPTPRTQENIFKKGRSKEHGFSKRRPWTAPGVLTLKQWRTYPEETSGLKTAENEGVLRGVAGIVEKHQPEPSGRCPRFYSCDAQPMLLSTPIDSGLLQTSRFSMHLDSEEEVSLREQRGLLMRRTPGADLRDGTFLKHRHPTVPRELHTTLLSTPNLQVGRKTKRQTYSEKMQMDNQFASEASTNKHMILPNSCADRAFQLLLPRSFLAPQLPKKTRATQTSMVELVSTSVAAQPILQKNISTMWSLPAQGTISSALGEPLDLHSQNDESAKNSEAIGTIARNIPSEDGVRSVSFGMIKHGDGSAGPLTSKSRQFSHLAETTELDNLQKGLWNFSKCPVDSGRIVVPQQTLMAFQAISHNRSEALLNAILFLIDRYRASVGDASSSSRHQMDTACANQETNMQDANKQSVLHFTEQSDPQKHLLKSPVAESVSAARQSNKAFTLTQQEMQASRSQLLSLNAQSVESGSLGSSARRLSQLVREDSRYLSRDPTVSCAISEDPTKKHNPFGVTVLKSPNYINTRDNEFGSAKHFEAQPTGWEKRKRWSVEQESGMGSDKCSEVLVSSENGVSRGSETTVTHSTSHTDTSYSDSTNESENSVHQQADGEPPFHPPCKHLLYRNVYCTTYGGVNSPPKTTLKGLSGRRSDIRHEQVSCGVQTSRSLSSKEDIENLTLVDKFDCVEGVVTEQAMLPEMVDQKSEGQTTKDNEQGKWCLCAAAEPIFTKQFSETEPVMLCEKVKLNEPNVEESPDDTYPYGLMWEIIKTWQKAKRPLNESCAHRTTMEALRLIFRLAGPQTSIASTLQALRPFFEVQLRQCLNSPPSLTQAEQDVFRHFTYQWYNSLPLEDASIKPPINHLKVTERICGNEDLHEPWDEMSALYSLLQLTHVLLANADSISQRATADLHACSRAKVTDGHYPVNESRASKPIDVHETICETSSYANVGQVSPNKGSLHKLVLSLLQQNASPNAVTVQTLEEVSSIKYEPKVLVTDKVPSDKCKSQTRFKKVRSSRGRKRYITPDMWKNNRKVNDLWEPKERYTPDKHCLRIISEVPWDPTVERIRRPTMASRVRRCQTFNQVYNVAVAALENRLTSDDPRNKRDVYSKLQVQDQNLFVTKMQKPPTFPTETGISHHPCNTLAITASLGAETIRGPCMDKPGTSNPLSYPNCPASSCKNKRIIQSETDPRISKESSMNVNCHYVRSVGSVDSDGLSDSPSAQRHGMVRVGGLDIQRRPISASCLSQLLPQPTKHSQSILQTSPRFCNKTECIPVNQQNQGNSSKFVIHSQHIRADDQNERGYYGGDANGSWNTQIAVDSYNICMRPSRVSEYEGAVGLGTSYPAPLFEHHPAFLTPCSVFSENSSNEDTTLYTAVPCRYHPSSLELNITDDHSTVKRPDVTDPNCAGVMVQNCIFDHGESPEAQHSSASYHELNVADRNSDGRHLNSMSPVWNMHLEGDKASETTTDSELYGGLIRGLLSRSSTPTGIAIPLHDAADSILAKVKMSGSVGFLGVQTKKDIPLLFTPKKDNTLDSNHGCIYRTSGSGRKIRRQKRRLLNVLSATESRQRFARVTQAKSLSNHIACSKMQIMQPLRCQSVPLCSLNKHVRPARFGVNGGHAGNGMVGTKCKDAVKSQKRCSTAVNPLWKLRTHSSKQVRSWSVGAARQVKPISGLHHKATERRNRKVHKKSSRRAFFPRQHWKNESSSENFKSGGQARQYNRHFDQHCASTKFPYHALTRSSSNILPNAVILSGVASQDETTLIRFDAHQASPSTNVDSVQSVSHGSSDDVHSLTHPTPTIVTDQEITSQSRQYTTSNRSFVHRTWGSERTIAKSARQYTILDTAEHACMQVDKYPSEWECSRASICHPISLTKCQEHPVFLARIVDKQLSQNTGSLPYDNREKTVRNIETPMSTMKLMNEMGRPNAGVCRIVDYTETSDWYLETESTSVSTPSETDGDAMGNGITEFDSNSQKPSVLIHPTECSGQEHIVKSLLTHPKSRKHSRSNSLPEQPEVCFMNESTEYLNERMSFARQLTGCNMLLDRIHSYLRRKTEESGDKRQSLCSDAALQYCKSETAPPDHGPMLIGFRPLPNQPLARRSCGDFCPNRSMSSTSLCPTPADFTLMLDFPKSQPDYLMCPCYMCLNSNSNQSRQLRSSTSVGTDSDDSHRTESGLDGSSTSDSVVNLTMDSGNSTVRSYSVSKAHSLLAKPSVICFLMNLKDNEVEPLNNEAFLLNHDNIKRLLQTSLGSRMSSAMPQPIMSNIISCAKSIAKLKRLRCVLLIGALNNANESENRQLLERQLDRLGSAVEVNQIHEGYVDGTVTQDSHNESMCSSLSNVTQAAANDTSMSETAFDSMSSLCDSRCRPLYQGEHDSGAEKGVSQWSSGRPDITKAPVVVQTVKPQSTSGSEEKQPRYSDKTTLSHSSALYLSGLPSDGALVPASVNTATTIETLNDTQPVQRLGSVDNNTEVLCSGEHKRNFKRTLIQKCFSRLPTHQLYTLTVAEAYMKGDRVTNGTGLSDARENKRRRREASIQDEPAPSDEYLSPIVGADVDAKNPQIESREQQFKTNPISYQTQQRHSQPVSHQSQNLGSADNEPHTSIRVPEPTPSVSLNPSCGFLNVDQMLYHPVVSSGRQSMLNEHGYYSMVDWKKGPGQESGYPLMRGGVHYMWHPAILRSLPHTRSNHTVTNDWKLKAATSVTEMTDDKCENPAESMLPFASYKQGTQNFNVNSTPEKNPRVTSSVSTVEVTPSDDFAVKNPSKQILDTNVKWNKSVDSDEFISRSRKNSEHNKGRLAIPRFTSNYTPKLDKLGPLASRSLPSKYPPSPWPMILGHHDAAPCSQTASPKLSRVSLSTASQLPYSHNGAQTSEPTEPSVNTGGNISHPGTPPRPPRRHWPSSRPQRPTKLPEAKQPPSSDVSSYVGDSSYSVDNTDQFLQQVVQLFSEPADSMPLVAEPELLNMESTPIVTQVLQIPSPPAQMERQPHDEILLNQQPDCNLAPARDDAGSMKRLTSTLHCPCPNHSDAKRCFVTPHPNSQGVELGHQVENRHVGHQVTKWKANYRLSPVDSLSPPESSQVRFNANVSLKMNTHHETGSTPTDLEPRRKGYSYLPQAEQESSGKLHKGLLTSNVRVITQSGSATISRTLNADTKVNHLASGELPAANQVVYTPVKQENPKTQCFRMGYGWTEVGSGPKLPPHLTDAKPTTVFISDNKCPHEALWETAANEKANGGRMKTIWSRPKVAYSAGMVHSAEELTLTTICPVNPLGTQSTMRMGPIRMISSYPQKKDPVDLIKKGREEFSKFRGPLNHPGYKSGQFEFELKPQNWVEYQATPSQKTHNIPSGADFPAPVVPAELSMHDNSGQRKELRVEKPLLTEVVELTNTERLSLEHPTVNVNDTGGLSKQRRIHNGRSDLPMDALSRRHDHLSRSSSAGLSGAPMSTDGDDKDGMRPISVQTNSVVLPVEELKLADRQLGERFHICHVQSHSITVSDNDGPPNQSFRSCATAESVMSLYTRHLTGSHQERDNQVKSELSSCALGNTKCDTNASHIVYSTVASSSATQRRLYYPTAVSAEPKVPCSPLCAQEEKALRRTNQQHIRKVPSNGYEVLNHAKSGRSAAQSHRCEPSYTSQTFFRGKSVRFLRTVSIPVRSTPEPDIITGTTFATTDPVSMQLRSDPHAYINKPWCRFKVLLQNIRRKRSLGHGTHNPSETGNHQENSLRHGVKETSPDSINDVKISYSQIPSAIMYRPDDYSPTSSSPSHVDNSSAPSCVTNTTAPLGTSISVSSSGHCVSAETDFFDMFTNTIAYIPPSY
ncbi:unnamed protein product [Dicrocoelium dendriticum]|nr:unnamed protein product [Dicrocoelium dendriticum]